MPIINRFNVSHEEMFNDKNYMPGLRRWSQSLEGSSVASVACDIIIEEFKDFKNYIKVGYSYQSVNFYLYFWNSIFGCNRRLLTVESAYRKSTSAHQNGRIKMMILNVVSTRSTFKIHFQMWVIKFFNKYNSTCLKGLFLFNNKGI